MFSKSKNNNSEISVDDVNDLDVQKTKCDLLNILIRKRKTIIFDSSSLSIPAFVSFLESNYETIHRTKDIFFIPEYEFESLSLDISQRLQYYIKNGSITLLQYTKTSDYIGLLTKLATMNKSNGQFCFVVNSKEKLRLILNAAKHSNVFVQFFMIDAIGNFIENKRERIKENNDKRENKASIYKDGDENKFIIKTLPEAINIIPISIEKRPCVGDVVFTSKNQPVKLKKQEIINPNSITYSTDEQDYWAKIYNPDSLNTFLEEKNKRMLDKHIQYKGLCWPLDILVDENGKFIGTLVPPAKGEPLHLSIFKQSKFQMIFPEWNKKDLCELAITILKIIQYLHKKNILMGCINPAAIRVVNKDEVYFVDTDNYQIEGFPTMVYNVGFTPPELQGQKIYLCKKENENFAIAVLVFMLMMTGKTPYSITQEENPSQSIVNGQFPYPNGNVHGSHAMPGVWRFMWSHLTPLKDAFYQTFQRDAKFNKPEMRKNINFWIAKLLLFKESLENPLDPESLKLYPQTFKRGKNDIFYKCRCCGIEYPEFYFDKKFFTEYQICNSCIDKPSHVSFTCKACGKTYFYTNRTAIFHDTMKKKDVDWADQKYCRDCKDKTILCSSCGEMKPYYSIKYGRCSSCNSKIYSKIRCSSCGVPFDITMGEYGYIKDHNYNLPTRCKKCRKEKRNNWY